MCCQLISLTSSHSNKVTSKSLLQWAQFKYISLIVNGLRDSNAPRSNFMRLLSKTCCFRPSWIEKVGPIVQNLTNWNHVDSSPEWNFQTIPNIEHQLAEEDPCEFFHRPWELNKVSKTYPLNNCVGLSTCYGRMSNKCKPTALNRYLLENLYISLQGRRWSSIVLFECLRWNIPLEIQLRQATGPVNHAVHLRAVHGLAACRRSGQTDINREWNLDSHYKNMVL